jgi:hypothetical protein
LAMGRDSLAFGRDALDTVDGATRNALAFAQDSGAQAYSFADNVARFMAEDSRDSRLFAENVTGKGFDFAGQSLDAVSMSQRDSMNFASEIARITAQSAEGARLENANLARHLSETAIAQVAQNKMDPEAQTIQNVAKFATIGAVAIGAVFIFRK